METLQSPSIDPGQFRRFASEVKFVIGRPLAEEVRSWARRNMLADPHGRGADQDAYTITTLYLDTAEFDVLARTGSFGRGKYRIRRYGSSDVIFLERKMKNPGSGPQETIADRDRGDCEAGAAGSKPRLGGLLVSPPDPGAAPAPGLPDCLRAHGAHG
ncbi:MAG: VTC domain-containing protein [Paludibaculum sp.]